MDTEYNEVYSKYRSTKNIFVFTFVLEPLGDKHTHKLQNNRLEKKEHKGRQMCQNIWQMSSVIFCLFFVLQVEWWRLVTNFTQISTYFIDSHSTLQSISLTNSRIGEK